ncbi:caspase, EACC1-associated type [Amycolatopsis mediterranei]|uniref:caspase, EACC1-associated type n=1 Tax=Amycolatopsis mediterranei TaxID=33910 RepID=UPI0008FFD28D|nr:caspase family protein [Amycolatopsis mediterranei]
MVGTATYTAGLPDMSAASRSLHAVRRALTGPSCGWPESRIAVFEDQNTGDRVPERVAKLIHETTDVLLFYYVGHGQLLPNEKLGLALTDTSKDPRLRHSTSLRFDDIRDELHYNCDARVRVVMLDCCFSGIATAGTQGVGVADQVEMLSKVEGAYTLTASRASEKAVYDVVPGGQTYFSKFLTAILEEGVPSANEYLSLAAVHKELRQRFRSLNLQDGRQRPEPSTMSRETAQDLLIARNSAYLPPPPPVPAADEVPAPPPIEEPEPAMEDEAATRQVVADLVRPTLPPDAVPPSLRTMLVIAADKDFSAVFGSYFDGQVFSAAAHRKGATSADVWAALIEHAARSIDWLPTDPYLAETAQAQAIPGLVSYTEDLRRAQLSHLERLVDNDMGQALAFLNEISDDFPATSAKIIVALGSRRPAAGGRLLLGCIDFEETVGLRLLDAALHLSATAILRRIVRQLSHQDITAIFLLCESRAPQLRERFLRLLPSPANAD